MTIALVTGANKGIGFATAEQLGRSGVKVFLGARDAERGAQAAEVLRGRGIDAEVLAIDVTDPASVRAAAATVEKTHGHLDVLVNNAGVLLELAEVEGDGPLVDLQTFKATFDTNVFGVVAVTEVFLPLLKAGPAGRIVNVSSRMGSLTDQIDPESDYYGMVVLAYQSSKAALNSITIGLAKALAATPIKVNAVCPGWVKTDIGGADAKAAAPMTPEEGAAIITRMALLRSDGPTGGFFHQSGPLPW